MCNVWEESAPPPMGPKNWAKEESLIRAEVNSSYQGWGRVKPCLFWVKWTRRRFWVQLINYIIKV